VYGKFLVAILLQVILCNELFYFSDWSDLVPEVGMSMLKWVYTDQVDFSRGDSFILDLMRTANIYRLEDLVAKYGKVFIFLNICVVDIHKFVKLIVQEREHFSV
jgi:hypothetical protein